MSDAPEVPSSSAAIPDPAPKVKRKSAADAKAEIKADLADLLKGDELPDRSEVEALIARCESAGVRRQVPDVLRNALLEVGDVAKASYRLALAECDRGPADYPKPG